MVHVSLPDIKYADLVNLVQFIYAGEITLNQRQCGILQKWLRALHIQLALQKKSSPPNIQEVAEETELVFRHTNLIRK